MNACFKQCKRQLEAQWKGQYFMSNVDDKITQCKNDIAKLQENLKVLEAEKNVRQPKLGDVWIDVYSTKLLIVTDGLPGLYTINTQGMKKWCTMSKLAETGTFQYNVFEGK
jgi:hypothetical protein